MGPKLAVRRYWMWRNGCEYSPSLEFGSYADSSELGMAALETEGKIRKPSLCPTELQPLHKNILHRKTWRLAL
jgi:hypothetical protein